MTLFDIQAVMVSKGVNRKLVCPKDRVLNHTRFFLVFALLLGVVPAIGRAGSPETKAPINDVAIKPEIEIKTFKVSEAFNQSEFSYEMKLAEKRRGYSIFHLTFPSPVQTPIAANNTVPAEYYLPDGASSESKRPAVLVLHILNGNFELERLLCTSLAVRGIPAVMIKLPYYGERSLPGGRAELVKRPELFVEACSQGIQDARRTIDLLASRPEVQPDRIGVTGISLGGLMSGATAGSDARVHRTCLLLAGGDLLAIIHHCREAKNLSEFLKQQEPALREKIETAIKGADPLTYADKLRERAQKGQVLMMNATEDDVIPPACSKKLAAALGIEDKIVWFEGLGHYTAIAALPQTFRRMVDFFAQDLPEGVKPLVGNEPPLGSPGQIVGQMLQNLSLFAGAEPAIGKCHLVDLTATVTDKEGKKHDGHIRLARGSDHRFRIEFKIESVGEGAWGQDTRPWMASPTTVFRGDSALPASDPLYKADPKYVAKYRALAGGLGGILTLPGLIEQALDIKEIKDDAQSNDPPAIWLSLKNKPKDSIHLTLDKDRRPTNATIKISDMSGEITFRAWQFNTIAVDGLFQPPTDRPLKEVSSSDLYRMFGATFDFLMEMSE